MFEVFDHTADLGLRIRAHDLPALFSDAALALSTVIAGDLSQIRPSTPHPFRLPPADPAFLLHDWLSEILFAFESRRLLFARFALSLSDAGLEARALGESFDPARHRLAHEVKAITYHALELAPPSPPDNLWSATVILDI